MRSQKACAYQLLIFWRGADPGNCSYNIYIISTRVVKSVIRVMYLNSWQSQAGRCNVSRQESPRKTPLK